MCIFHRSTDLHYKEQENPQLNTLVLFTLRTAERPMFLFYSHKQDTHTDIIHIFRCMYRYTVLLYNTCKDKLYFCEHNSYKRDTHIHTDITIYITIHVQIYCTQLLLTDCTPVYTTVHCFKSWRYVNTLAVHTLCLDQLYCCTSVLSTCSDLMNQIGSNLQLSITPLET